MGDHVTGTFGVQDYAVADARGVQKVDAGVATMPTHLSVLGMTGMTAYFRLFDVGGPRDGETVVVSGAAGRLHSREDVVRGAVSDFPETLLRLLRGDNTGKLVLQIAD